MLSDCVGGDALRHVKKSSFLCSQLEGNAADRTIYVTLWGQDAVQTKLNDQISEDAVHSDIVRRYDVGPRSSISTMSSLVA